MAVVLDAPVLIGVAMKDPQMTRMFESAIEEGRCYVTISTVEEFVCVAMEHCGSKLTAKWIEWLYSVRDIEIVEIARSEYLSEEFVGLTGEAYVTARIDVPAATAATLARKMSVPVLTNRLSFAELEAASFCEVRWPLDLKPA